MFQTRIGQYGLCVLVNFSKTAERNKTLFTGNQDGNEFKTKSRSKIGSFQKEIFKHKGTVPNDQNDQKHHVQS